MTQSRFFELLAHIYVVGSFAADSLVTQAWCLIMALLFLWGSFAKRGEGE